MPLSEGLLCFPAQSRERGARKHCVACNIGFVVGRWWSGRLIHVMMHRLQQAFEGWSPWTRCAVGPGFLVVHNNTRSHAAIKVWQNRLACLILFSLIFSLLSLNSALCRLITFISIKLCGILSFHISTDIQQGFFFLLRSDVFSGCSFNVFEYIFC